ncbi:unnamed protein product [Leuciscus chuanchicus]
MKVNKQQHCLRSERLGVTVNETTVLSLNGFGYNRVLLVDRKRGRKLKIKEDVRALAAVGNENDQKPKPDMRRAMPIALGPAALNQTCSQRATTAAERGIGLQPILGCERADLWPESFSLHYGTLMKDEEGIRHNYSCSDLALSTHLISELGGMRNFNQIPDILLRVLLQLGHDSEPGVCLVSLDISPMSVLFY